MNNILIDSSVWISFYNESDSCHQKAFDELPQIFDEKEIIFIPENVVSETYTILLYKCGKHKAMFFLDFILQHKKIEIMFMNDSCFQNIYSLLPEIKKKLSFVDASLIVFTEHLNCKLLTYDKELKKVMEQR